ncbi:hypothetical protein GLYMA_18G002100v4 [Glycine max]|uniref:Uncharacterized protein n=1 Tax=Glycine max TaxID=3847 RepID=K7MP59_SOYBN|nr:hypothetical protein GYH30_048565 [Glycine max]KRG97347.1 hypothetical protein GLYMA_18G002100v4 [Glycine max]
MSLLSSVNKSHHYIKFFTEIELAAQRDWWNVFVPLISQICICPCISTSQICPCILRCIWKLVRKNAT